VIIISLDFVVDMTKSLETSDINVVKVPLPTG